MIDDRDYPEFRKGASYAALSDPEALIKLARMKMPFGKYAGRYLVDLPENYVLWFKQKGFPEGDLGKQMAAICEIQANGLEDLLRPLRQG
jgi:uncharacterized protein (DUF3820 family)